jgi:hypothetical protein
MRSTGRASVSDTTPTIPARTATISENRFGLSIRFETGRTPSEYARGVWQDQRIARPKISVTMTAVENPASRARAPRRIGGLVPLVDAERDTHDRVVFQAHDHGADDEDLRIGQDADGADEPGYGQEDVETGSLDGIGADFSLDDVPHTGAMLR